MVESVTIVAVKSFSGLVGMDGRKTGSSPWLAMGTIARAGRPGTSQGAWGDAGYGQRWHLLALPCGYSQHSLR